MNPPHPTPSESARQRFDANFNCAQAVFAAFAPQWGLTEEQALKLASPFGGGVARRGQVCGAVSGGLMALGLARGAHDPLGKEAAYQLGQDFLRRFEALHGSLLCRELLKVDISTPAGHQQARDQGLFTRLCPLFVGDAARIVEEMLDER